VSMYVWLFQGLTPLGGFTAGWIANRAGIPPALLGAGGACLMGGMALGLSRAAGPRAGNPGFRQFLK